MAALEPLTFVTHPVSDLGSVVPLFATKPPEEKIGIYILHFANGEEYIGKTINIVDRYADHYRRWDDIASLSFAVCAAQDLNLYEPQVIAAERQAHSIRNIMLTDRPGGDGIAFTMAPNGAAIALPWERSARVKSRATGDERIPDRKLAQANALRGVPEYQDILEILGTYIHETIADPEQTVGLTWFLSAMPATKAGGDWVRLLTLSCGGLETFIVFMSPDELPVFEFGINVAPRSRPELLGRKRALKDVEVRAVETYRAARAVRIDAVGPDVRAVLEQEEVLDAAYQLNTELMRKGDRKFARFHNAEFAKDALEAARRVAGV